MKLKYQDLSAKLRDAFVSAILCSEAFTPEGSLGGKIEEELVAKVGAGEELEVLFTIEGKQVDWSQIMEDLLTKFYNAYKQDIEDKAEELLLTTVDENTFEVVEELGRIKNRLQEILKDKSEITLEE